ncbi:unnamed protein product [Euphydryas editha]|uniref:Uncharacterized protein n=1 Tax=Euphydryas editha TaxID=104508 RepID=A0AAU9URE1_EUPED|nr:unnamed protein product [Euphydryas editha]
MKQFKKNVVLSLAGMSSSIKIQTVIAKKNEEDVADLLTYELTSFPKAQFHEGVRRKGKKSSLYDILPVENNVDGGFLLHRVFPRHEKNKARLIQFLAEKTTAAGIETTVAAGDADGTIVRCGLDKAAIQQCLGNPLPPTQWGWARGDNGILKPVTTKDPVAPDSILNTIFCRRTTGCRVRCGCRKAGIAFSSVCGVCSGSCTNGARIENTVDDDVDDDILDLEDN